VSLVKKNPTSPGRRGAVLPDFSELTSKETKKSLLQPIKKHSGRNNKGRITVRHRGGGHKRKYRIIDFKRSKIGILGIVDSIQYDPNRSSNLALIKYKDGDWSYILSPEGLKVGDTVVSDEKTDVSIGNCMPLKNIPSGSEVHNIELNAGQGAKLVRSAGNSAQVLATEGEHTLIRLPSGEMRRIHKECKATIGSLGNQDHKNIKLGKAGKNRHKGKRPSVRGVAMAPNAHPHGGGEGKSPIGMPGPKTPWGRPALGKKTRKKKPSDKFIIRSRKR
jgi:large subunit ribosomal protein L2|tara:strand:+ start:1061 stop:1888 length:828 start_codon:yes stop_codon:yes gene_type:complete